MKNKFKKIIGIVSIIFILPVSSRADLAHRVESIVASQTQAKVRFAVQIVNPDTGAVIYNHSAATPLIPASNMKLITAASALKYLGPDFVYQTRVGFIGDSLAVIGSGDPILGDKPTAEKMSFDPRWMLRDIAQQIQAAKISSISDIIVDSAIFDDERVHPSWPKAELNRWYESEISGLNYNGNCIEIIAETVGSRVQLTLDPPTDYVKIINKSTPTSKSPDTIWGSREPNSNTITVIGSCYKKCQPIRVTIDRPPAFFGYLLAEELKREGITIHGRLLEQEIPVDRQFRTIAVYQSSIWDVFARCNKDSLELAAECLLKTTAASKRPNGRGGSWAAGQQLIGQYLSSLGIPSDQFLIDDGCGLSEKNRLSANTLAKVLLDIHRGPNWEKFKQTLAVGGMDGTIDKYFNEPKYKGKVFAKTGYIEGVKALSGVCTTDRGDIIFSIITNKPNGETRQAINDIVKAIIDENR